METSTLNDTFDFVLPPRNAKILEKLFKSSRARVIINRRDVHPYFEMDLLTVAQLATLDETKVGKAEGNELYNK